MEVHQENLKSNNREEDIKKSRQVEEIEVISSEDSINKNYAKEVIVLEGSDKAKALEEEEEALQIQESNWAGQADLPATLGTAERLEHREEEGGLGSKTNQKYTCTICKKKNTLKKANMLQHT